MPEFTLDRTDYVLLSFTALLLLLVGLVALERESNVRWHKYVLSLMPVIALVALVVPWGSHEFMMRLVLGVIVFSCAGGFILRAQPTPRLEKVPAKASETPAPTATGSSARSTDGPATKSDRTRSDRPHDAPTQVTDSSRGDKPREPQTVGSGPRGRDRGSKP